MKYSDISGFFSDKDMALEILNECSETFNRIDEIGASVRSNGFQHPMELEALTKELNGIYAFLNPILGVATSVKQEEEDRFYNSKKMELEKAGAKVVATILEKEASEYIANFRRVRNVIESYVAVVNTNIMSTLSLLKNIERERVGANATS